MSRPHVNTTTVPSLPPARTRLRCSHLPTFCSSGTSIVRSSHFSSVTPSTPTYCFELRWPPDSWAVLMLYDCRNAFATDMQHISAVATLFHHATTRGSCS